jgi:fructose-1,6-bisphosphatase-3
MQKAAAVMQFKLEGQMIARNPQWDLDHRRPNTGCKCSSV